MSRHIALTVAISLNWSCTSESPPPEPTDVALVDITDQIGLDMTTVAGHTPPRQIIDVNGPGLALLDIDGDADIDLFVANGATSDDPEHGPGCRLFRNLLTDTGSLRFQDATDEAGIKITRWATGASAWDIDLDGDVDLYVTCMGQDVLLLNDGLGHFTDATAASGIVEDDWTTAAVPVDIDADGDLDLYLVNYVDWDFEAPDPPRVDFRGTSVLAGPAGLTPAPDRLLINAGDGTFEDATVPLGLSDLEPAYGLNAVSFDIDEDGVQDVLVGNDGMANALLRLDQDGRLVDDGQRSGFATNMAGAKQATMGMAVGDVDADGRADIFTTNFSSDTNTMLLGRGASMVDRTHALALGAPSRPLLGWTTRLIDLDHDGDEDLLTLNGHVYPEATVESIGSAWAQPVLVQMRSGSSFSALDTSDHPGWLNQRRVDRCGVFGDLDRDGDLDLITAELGGPVRVIENRAASPSHRGVMLTLHDDRPESGNPAGLGARIVVNGTHHRWITPGSEFQGWSAPQAHVAVDRSLQSLTIDVQWPDGVETRHVLGTADVVEVRHQVRLE